MNTPSLDYYTAEPILLLLLAQQEIEEPDIPPDAALGIFQRFVDLPYDGEEEGIARA